MRPPGELPGSGGDPGPPDAGWDWFGGGGGHGIGLVAGGAAEAGTSEGETSEAEAAGPDASPRGEPESDAELNGPMLETAADDPDLVAEQDSPTGGPALAARADPLTLGAEPGSPTVFAGPASAFEAAPFAEADPEAADPPRPRPRFQVLTGGRSASAPAESEPPVTADDDPDTPGADFRVRCPDCGPQYVAVADIRFVSTGGGADTDRYLFSCPACGVRVRRPAGPELAEILKTSGVATLALRRAPGQAL